MSENLAMEFEQAMYDIYRNALMECGYNATYFHQMLVDKGGVQTARQLLNDDEIHEGLVKLWKLDRLDLTVEAEVWENAKWRPLFNESEIEKAEQRLRGLNYFK